MTPRPPPHRLVPQGVLVFFPSMAALSGAAEQWGKRGSDGGPTVLERLEKHKRVIIEPRGQAEVAPALEQQEEYRTRHDCTRTRAMASFLGDRAIQGARRHCREDRRGRRRPLRRLPRPAF